MIDLVTLTNCPVCGASDTETVSENVKTINTQSDVTTNLMGCLSCGHWWNSPAPTQRALIDMYQEGSAFVISENWGDDIQKDKPILFFDRLILDYPYPESFRTYLEVGCGAGHMLRMMQGRVATAFGIEPGQWGSDANIVADIDEIAEELRFSILVFQDVIEHVADPVATLISYSARATPEAVLFVSFPNKDALIAQRNKGRWGMVRPFGHLHYFSRRSLTLLLEASGWQVAQVFRGPNRFSPTYWKTYNLPRTLKKLYQNDQWYIVGERALKR